MLYTNEQISGRGIFHEWGRNNLFASQDWESKLPDLTSAQMVLTANSAISNETMEAEFQRGGEFSIVSGLRNVMARVAMTWGYFQRATSLISTVFKATMAAVELLVGQAADFLNSAGFKTALDALGVIPIVGWIIAIIRLVVGVITGIVKAVRKKRKANEEEDARELALEWALPLGAFDVGADTLMSHLLMDRLAPNTSDFSWLILPPVLATSSSDFIGRPQKFAPTDECKSAWLIGGIPVDEGGPGGGLGYVPGTMNLHMSLSMRPDSDYGAIRDMGAFYPVTQMLAANIWSQAVQGDTGLMFAADMDFVRQAWANYLQAAIEFAYGPLAKGWSTVSGTTEFNSNMYKCGRCDPYKSNCGTGDKDKDWGKERTIPQWDREDHQHGYVSYFREMFELHYVNGDPLLARDDTRKLTPNQIDFDNTICGRYLDIMYERQLAKVNSIHAMYLDDADVSLGSNTVQRFLAIRRGTQLHKAWVNNVTALFESGDWERIDYRDVIKGSEVDVSLHNAIHNRYKTTPDKFFNMDKSEFQGQGRKSLGLQAVAGPTVLEDPEPPEPPDPVDFETLGNGGVRSPSRQRPKSGKSSGGGMGLAVAAIAAAVLFNK